MSEVNITTGEGDGYGYDYDYDLGSFHRPVSTSSSAAQTWFNRGLIWSYAFNHEEAIGCFEAALANDPDCAMAYWGLAYAMGPNYNKPWDFFDEDDLSVTLKRAREAIAKAKAVVGGGKASRGGEEVAAMAAIEAKLIDTLQFRYPTTGKGKDFPTWNREYASALGEIYQDYPDDFDVAALYAEALMNLTPWQLWDLRTGQPAPGARTMEAKRVLDRALAQSGAHSHPGLLHLYIHLMEMSGAPESAMAAANHLRGLVPDAGHLNHMPTHLDMLCGDYQQAIESNSDAVVADEKFLARKGPVNFYSLYRSHDYHFLIYAAMFAGRSKVALETAERAEASLPEEVMRVESPPMADWLEGFLSVRLHVLIRFGRWREIIDLHLPQDKKLYCTTTAMMHYAKGVAFAASGEVDRADEQRAHFHTAVKRVPSTRILFNNSCLDVLAVAGAMLDGELEYRRGNYDVAFDHLRKSISLDDNLPYDEPWGWMQPTRHAYGALLLEQGHVEQAAAVYRADLGLDDTLPRALRHPNNVWALHGYHECLVRLGRAGKGKEGEDEIAAIHEKLQRAAEVADVPIVASCFCRLSAVGGDTGAECCGK